MVQPTDSSNGETFNIQYYIQVSAQLSITFDKNISIRMKNIIQTGYWRH